MIERIRNFESVILGINDGLIELSGALVGLTFALKTHELVALSGLVTGIAAALSMSASAFMHTRHEVGKNAALAAGITGISYIVVVSLLVMPYFVFENLFVSMGVMLAIALSIVFIIAKFNSVYLGTHYHDELGLMLVFSLGVAGVSFLIGHFLREFIKI
jgi:VIT1/CCC1 family predicted Fe2+/Mn2+ transporter